MASRDAFPAAPSILGKKRTRVRLVATPIAGARSRAKGVLSPPRVRAARVRKAEPSAGFSATSGGEGGLMRRRFIQNLTLCRRNGLVLRARRALDRARAAFLFAHSDAQRPKDLCWSGKRVDRGAVVR